MIGRSPGTVLSLAPGTTRRFSYHLQPGTYPLSAITARPVLGDSEGIPPYFYAPIADGRTFTVRGGRTTDVGSIELALTH